MTDVEKCQRLVFLAAALACTESGTVNDFLRRAGLKVRVPPYQHITEATCTIITAATSEGLLPGEP